MRKSLRLQKLLTRSGETVVRMTRATVAVNNYRGFYRQIIHIVSVSILNFQVKRNSIGRRQLLSCN